MTEHDEAAPDADATRIPVATTPTWETELLISAAVVFALFQIPGVLDDFHDRWSPRFSGNAQILGLFLLIYAKIVLFALVATFVTHLCARGYWTALVGIRSVFPHGVRWENAGRRPIFVELMKRELPSQGATIERIDNFASLIFGTGAMLVILALFSLLMTLAGLVAATVLSQLFFDGKAGDALFLATTAVFIVPLVIAGTVDRLFGHRLDPTGPTARMVRAVLKASLWVPLLRASNAILLLFSTNVGRRRGTVFATGALYLLIGVVMFQTMARRDGTHLDSYAYFPSTDQDVVSPRHYATGRLDVDRFALAPFIQDETIDGPYLRLFVPYAPSRLNAAISDRCPDVAAAGAKEPAARDRAVLDCVAVLFAVQLDGKAMADGTGFDFATDAPSGLRGFLARLAIGDLARGRHELTLDRLPRGRRGFFAEDEPAPPRERITFWR